jgi:Uma2 family endonuclease
MTTTARFTTRDLDAFPDNEFYRYEIIDGELHVTKAPGGEHQIICGRLIVVLGVWNDSADMGFVLTAPGVVFTEEDAVIPDVVWVRKDRYPLVLDAARHFIEAPELVIEVLSPGSSNQRRDRELKLGVYDRRAVPEYWIVDWEHKQVLVYRREGAELPLITTLTEAGTLTSPQLPGFACPVSSLFAGLPS